MRTGPVGVPLLALLLLVAGAVAPAVAQEGPSRLYPTIHLGASAAVVAYDSDVRVDSDDGTIGTDIDTERLLGLSRTKVQPRVNVRWRPGRRHEVEVGYQFARRSGEKVIEETFEFDGETFEAGAAVATDFSSDNLFLTYRFAFTAHDRQQIGFGLGLGVIFQDIRLQALASLSNGDGSRDVEFQASESLPAPTASAGLYARFQFGDDFVFEPDLRGLIVKVDRYKATIAEAGLGGRYFVSNTVAFEAGWTGQFVEVKVDPKFLDDRIDEAGGRLRYLAQTARLGIVLIP